ncbi:GFA family protein [Devosia aurantiaca]|uniref:GFA family protein n=1 Tax=Devosia aurantiaca TaxID=2714858 RepID=A0A6M1SH11_9HYPH|nr:GFA family protein [Devosia aurantiaca]NGP18747.1 GFA family protein [Devosia aurantiaca]
MDRVDIEVSGGCQCGAVRYHATQMLDNAHICHCRMCQKAAGNIFIALVAAPKDAVTWTRGTPGRFRSSEHVDRGFCAQCGTPLFYETITGDRINFTIGSLDHPELFPPRTSDGNEGKVPWFESILSLRDNGTTGSGPDDDAAWAAAIASSNRQHPDYDTQVWPE